MGIEFSFFLKYDNWRCWKEKTYNILHSKENFLWTYFHDASGWLQSGNRGRMQSEETKSVGSTEWLFLLSPPLLHINTEDSCYAIRRLLGYFLPDRQLSLSPPLVLQFSVCSWYYRYKVTVCSSTAPFPDDDDDGNYCTCDSMTSNHWPFLSHLRGGGRCVHAEF